MAICLTCYTHDDVIKWKHFPRNWPFVRGIHRSPVNFPHKGQWRRALMFSLICVWINDWVNNRGAGDLRRYRSHYDVIVMQKSYSHNPVNTPQCGKAGRYRHNHCNASVKHRYRSSHNISVTYERHSVWNDRQLDRLFTLASNIKAPHYWSFVRGICLRGIHQWPVESSSMSWRHHGWHTVAR